MKNEGWNEAGIPLAYLFTFRCYGTWLHGDERGAVDRFNNKYEMPFLPPNNKWQRFVESRLKYEPVKLNGRMRKSVETAVEETCQIRGWNIYAVNVRTNHCHSVVDIGNESSKKALNALKANATRQMREDGWWPFDHSPWAEKGSRRFLWTEKSIEMAIDYVVNGQGKPLPDFNCQDEQ
ncbi:MAG: transposase [Acidobacteria bacterium]|nr:transposase [Acidobacteriota bacterium]